MSFFLQLAGGGDSEGKTTSPDDLERGTQALIPPPFLPGHEQVVTNEPKVVQVRLEIEDKLIEIDSDDTKIWAPTLFKGSVPGQS